MTLEPWIVEYIAQLTHEQNRAYCILLDDHSQSHWNDAPEWQKDSARKGVLAALSGQTPKELHASWAAQKRAEGWNWGWIKDPEKKEHPCLVDDYEDLPAEQRLKDQLFSNMVQYCRQQLELIQTTLDDESIAIFRGALQ